MPNALKDGCDDGAGRSRRFGGLIAVGFFGLDMADDGNRANFCAFFYICGFNVCPF